MFIISQTKHLFKQLRHPKLSHIHTTRIHTNRRIFPYAAVYHHFSGDFQPSIPTSMRHIPYRQLGYPNVPPNLHPHHRRSACGAENADPGFKTCMLIVALFQRGNQTTLKPAAYQDNNRSSESGTGNLSAKHSGLAASQID